MAGGKRGKNVNSEKVEIHYLVKIQVEMQLGKSAGKFAPGKKRGKTKNSETAGIHYLAKSLAKMQPVKSAGKFAPDDKRGKNRYPVASAGKLSTAKRQEYVIW